MCRIAAATELADTEGLGALSMARLGARGVPDDPAAQFHVGLNRLLDGIEAEVGAGG